MNQLNSIFKYFSFSLAVSGILLIALSLPLLSTAQSSDPTARYIEEEVQERNFDRVGWKESISDIDYSKELQRKRQRTPPEQERDTSDSPSFDFDLNSSLSTILLVIIGIVLLLVLVRYTLKEGNVVRNRKINSTLEELSLAEIEENLEAHDPTNLIEKAIQEKNYRLALRLYYLKIIRELSLSGAIEWKKDKTNRMYFQELRVEDWRSPFQAITLAFERIWYGNRLLEESEFELLQPQLDQLLEKISMHEK